MKERHPIPQAPIHTADLGLHVEGSPVRCPFCHTGIELETDPWVACAGCVARHHGECWGEGGGVCGACGNAEALTRADTAQPTPARTGYVRLPLCSFDERSRSSFLLGGPTQRSQVASFAGELDLAQEAAWLEAEVRRALKVEGATRLHAAGTRLEWRPAGRAGSMGTSVTLDSQGQQTRLRVEESYGDLYGTLYGSLVGGLGGGLSAPVVALVMALPWSYGPELKGILAFLVVVAWVLVVSLGVRALIPYVLGRRQQRSKQLMERLVRKLARPDGPQKPSDSVAE